jgi:hypothetical protein
MARVSNVPSGTGKVHLTICQASNKLETLSRAKFLPGKNDQLTQSVVIQNSEQLKSWREFVWMMEDISESDSDSESRTCPGKSD